MPDLLIVASTLTDRPFFLVCRSPTRRGSGLERTSAIHPVPLLATVENYRPALQHREENRLSSFPENR
jgi:hypothetical protein